MEAERFGGPQVLTARQVPDPVAGPGQVVVRTSAADVLFAPDRSRAPARARRHPDLTAGFGCPDPRNCSQSRIHPPATAPAPPSPLRPTLMTMNLLRPDLSV